MMAGLPKQLASARPADVTGRVKQAGFTVIGTALGERRLQREGQGRV